MSKKSFLLGAIASVIAINSVFADTIVTSKSYVDTTRQATIPVSGTNASTPGTTVVTYTNTAGTIGERGICNDPDEDDCNGGDLVTVDHFMGFAAEVDNAVNNINIPTTITTNKTCVGWLDGQPNTDENCILWQLVEQDVYGRCTKNSDCNCSNSPDTPYGYCDHGACRCIDTAPSR